MGIVHVRAYEQGWPIPGRSYSGIASCLMRLVWPGSIHGCHLGAAAIHAGSPFDAAMAKSNPFLCTVALGQEYKQAKGTGQGETRACTYTHTQTLTSFWCNKDQPARLHTCTHEDTHPVDLAHKL
eukprot:1158024-Pelagomonas_calceolata.AAC.2